MKQYLTFILALGLLAACGAKTPTQAGDGSATELAPGWQSLKFSQSGGIAGTKRSLQITRDGHGAARNEAANKQVTFELTLEQLAQLGDLISGVVDAGPVTLDLNCADCFAYKLQIVFPSQTGEVQLSDVQLPGSAYEPLITFLRTLMDQVLQ